MKALPTATNTFERDDMPIFLKSFENLIGHFDEHFGELGSNDRGDNFLNLAAKLIPLSIFLGKSRVLLENNSATFRIAYRHAFAAVADSLLDTDDGEGDAAIQQSMFHKVSTMSFDGLFKRILLRIDSDSHNKA